MAKYSHTKNSCFAHKLDALTRQYQTLWQASREVLTTLLMRKHGHNTHQIGTYRTNGEIRELQIQLNKLNQGNGSGVKKTSAKITYQQLRKAEMEG